MSTPVTAPMELDFDLCQRSDCTSFDIKDTTGVYSSGNSGGYGNPNFDISDAIDARIYVTTPAGVQTIIDCFPTLPDSTGASTFTITSSNLGSSGSLVDGIYVVKYQVDFTNASAQTVQYDVVKTLLLSCTIKCCIDKLIAKIATLGCGCDDTQLKNALLAYGLYQSLLYNGKCGNTPAVTNLLSQLNKLCITSNCGCGQ